MAVTGQLGGEDIRLDNAATEATLQELVKAVSKMSGGRSGGNGEKVEKLHENLTKSNKSLDDFGDAADEAGETLEDFGDKTLNATKAIGGFFYNSLKNLSVGAVNWAANLATSGNRITDITETIPLVGNYLKPLASIIDSNVDAFREMSAAGASFGNSMESMRLAAASSRLNLDQFQKLVGESSETFAVFGSTVTDGARRFARLSGSLREGELGDRLMGMGFTIEDVNSGLSSYLELQARQGRLEQMSNTELREGAGEYLEQLDALTKVTGMQRKEAEQAMLAQQEESKMRVMRATATNKEAFDANMALLDQLGAAGGAFKDLSDGVAQTDIGQKLQAIAPGATELAQQMASGSINAEEARNRLAEIGPQIEEFAREVGPAALESFGGSMSGLLQLLDENYKMQRLNNDAEEGLAAEEQERRAKITQALGGFEQTVESIRTRILEYLINSPVWEAVTGAFEDLIPAAGEDGLSGVLEKLNPMMESLAGWINQFMAEVKQNGIVETLKKYVGEAFAGLGGMIKEFLFGTGDTEQTDQKRQQLESQKRDLQTQAATGSGATQQVAQDKIASIDEELAKIEEKKTGVLSGILEPIMNFSWPKALLAGGAAIGGLFALSKAFGAFAAPQVMLGVGVVTGALVGTGAAIKLAGEGIDLAGDGIEKVADGMQRMSELKDVSKLQDIGTSLGNMGDGLLKLAGGNVIDSITSFFGADSPFDKIIKGVNKFAEVDNSAFANLLHTSTSLKQIADVDFDTKGMDVYTDNVRGIARAIGSIDPHTLDSLKSFAATDLRQSVSNLSNISEIEFDSSGIESYKDAIENLTEALQGLNSELQEDNNSGFMGRKENLSAGELLSSQQGSSQSGNSEKIDQLNRVMQDILGVLLQSNDMTNKQLRATRGMVGNLY